MQTSGGRLVSDHDTRTPTQMRDFRYAFRTLRSAPFVNAVAILSLH